MNRNRNHNNNRYQQPLPRVDEYPPEAQAPPHHQPGHSNGRRRDRAQQFRQRTNETVVKEYHTQTIQKLTSNLFSEYDDFAEYLKRTNVSPQAEHVHINCSSRAIGLALYHTVLRIHEQIPDLDPPLNAMYRTALAQLEAQFDIASQDKGFHVDTPAEVEHKTLSQEQRELVLSNPVHLTSITGIVNSLGHFTIGNIKYVPTRYTYINPFQITLSTLREYVLLGSQEDQASLPQRQEMFALNSIPSALWGDVPLNPHIINADEIIPANYDIDQLSVDFRATKAFVGRVSKKMPKYCGSCSFEPTGNPGALICSTQSSDNRDTALSIRRVYGPNLPDWPEMTGRLSQFYSLQPLSGPQAVVGILSLFGEIPRIMPAEVYLPGYLSRNPHNGCEEYSTSYKVLLEGMLG